MMMQSPQWLVIGLISASLTVISGKPKSGKSALVLNFVVSAVLHSDFLGRTISATNRIIIVATDADGVGCLLYTSDAADE